MIVSLRGRLIAKDTQRAVIECGGVGYGVFMSLASLARLPAEGSEASVHVHTRLTDDALQLYGFCDEAERRAFEVLIATTGVGPRLALAILSSLSPSELAQAIADGDKAALTHISGVGAKRAERLLVELKGRLVCNAAESAAPRGRAALRADLASALANLGFKTSDAEQVARRALDELPDETDLARLVRKALARPGAPEASEPRDT